jgi:NAD(P)-dependent dehydrogenase (short-subunit alcohol dehydrogenase family)
MGLAGRVAIVTGASAGIGRAYALALAAEGAAVVAAARRLGDKDTDAQDANTLATLVRAGSGLAGTIHAQVCDMEKESDICSLIEHTASNFGRIDVLVNNAAILGKLATLKISAEIFDRFMTTNIRGPYVAIREVAPHMMRQQAGSIINISAAVGHMTPKTNYPGFLVYGISKAGLDRLSYYMAAELKPYNVAVNALSPGVVASESALKTNPQVATSGTHKPATPEVLGPPLVYLAAQTAQSLTGQWLHSDEFGKSWGI